jgi:hypothetical protein
LLGGTLHVGSVFCAQLVIGRRDTVRVNDVACVEPCVEIASVGAAIVDALLRAGALGCG